MYDINMSYMPALDAVSGADWPDLAVEFDRWHEAGRTALLWWRDDDAVAATSQLTALLRLADGIPLAVGAIPAHADPGLAAALERAPQVSVIQHGWQHRNHAVQGKKSEYPPGRQPQRVAAELAAGHARLVALFGDRARPVFVPPWNRFAAEFLPLLSAAGLTGLSAMAPRHMPLPPGIAAFDVHLDLVDWHCGRGFIGTRAALGRMIGCLRAMRAGEPAAPALGVLTHHLIMDHATEDFLAELVPVVASHPAARWASIGELLT